MTTHKRLVGLLVLSIVVGSGSVFAQVQTAEQVKCLKALNKAGKKVARKTGKENQRCLKNAGKAKISDLQRCSVEDGKNRVEKARRKTTRDENKKCLATPDFGYIRAETVNAAATGQEAGLLGDLFGTDVNQAVILRDHDKDGAKCQFSVLRETDKLLQANLQQFFVCANTGLKSKLAPITSASGLEECLQVVAADPKGKVAKKTAQLTKVMGKVCAAQDLSAAFPGICAGAADFVGCVKARVNCRTCLMLNLMHGLDADCELYDDGQSNGSCVTRVPDDHATIQQAIDAVPDGGTVLVKPGTYGESISVIGKRIALIGGGSEGPRRTEIAGVPPLRIPEAELATGKITYGGGGGGRIQGFAVRGGETGILGVGSTAPLSPLHVEDLVISESARGILGKFSELSMKGVNIHQSLGNGVTISCFKTLLLSLTWIHDTRGVGFLALTCGESDIIRINGESELSNNDTGGLAVIGDDAVVEISDSTVAGNQNFGIFLFHAGKSFIVDTAVSATAPIADKFGDGIVAIASGPIFMVNAESTGNARAGIILLGCSPENQTDFSARGIVSSQNRWGLLSGYDTVSSVSCSVGCPGGVFNDLGLNTILGNTAKQVHVTQDCGGEQPVPETPAVPEE